MIFKVLAVVSFIGLSHALEPVKTGKPKSIDFSRIGTCAYKNDLKSNFELKYDDSTKLVNGEISVPFDLDSSIMFSLSLMKLHDDGKWKLSKNMTASVCNFMGIACPSCWKTLVSNMEVKNAKDCFIPKGTYKIKDISFATSDVVMNMPFGQFKADIIMTKGKNQIGCFPFEAKVQG